MSRKARTRSSLALGLIVFIVAGLWFASRQLARAGETPIKSGDTVSASRADATSPARIVVFPLPAEFKVRLLRAGLHPRALCAAGITPGTTLAALQAAADTMNAAPTAMDSADASYVSSRVAADALARKIQSGKANPTEIASYPGAQAALQSADGARGSVLDGYFAAAIASLPTGQRTALTKIRANRAWGFPDEYLVVSRTDAEWLALRDALSNERIAVEMPDTLSAPAQALLATVRANPAVAAARTNIQNALTLLTNAWNTAAGD